jgi:hypothetical protein
VIVAAHDAAARGHIATHVTRLELASEKGETSLRFSYSSRPPIANAYRAVDGVMCDGARFAGEAFSMSLE